MPVVEYNPAQANVTSSGGVFEGIDIIGMLFGIVPYILLFVIVGVIVAVVYYVYFLKPKQKPDYNLEVYKRVYKQLLGVKLNKGMGKVFFSLAFSLLGFLIGGWVFEGNIPFSIISALMLYFISKVITTGFSHKFDVEHYVYDKDFDKFGMLESSAMLTGDGLQYFLVSRGKPAMFFPKYEILALPAQKTFKFKGVDKNGKEKWLNGSISDFDKFMVKNERGDIMVNCKTFEKHAYYYFPVINLKSNVKGESSLFSFREIAFNVNKNLVNEIAVYDLLNENYQNIFKAVNANPMIRVGIKSKDIDVEDNSPQIGELQN